MAFTSAVWQQLKSLTAEELCRVLTPGSYEDGEPVNIRLGVLGIGDTALASVNAEVYR